MRSVLWIVWAAVLPLAASPARPSPPARIESLSAFLAKLSPAQRAQFGRAQSAYGARQFGAALQLARPLLAELPKDELLVKFASAAAIQSGDLHFAVGALAPLARTDADDWQVAALRVRACAESGDLACRNAEMAQLAALHRRGLTPRWMNRYVVEEVRVGKDTLRISQSLVPWGRYHVYDLGELFGPRGQRILQMTLESDDVDQPFFAHEHPKQAAHGVGAFSYDGYEQHGPHSFTHLTYRLGVDGEPPYDSVRAEFLAIVRDQSQPFSATLHSRASH